MDDLTRPDGPRCPRCGNPLAGDTFDGLCPACLLATGMESDTRSSTDEASTVLASGARSSAERLRFEPGQVRGRYRIGRMLGRGGMGEVYEAEQLDTGRRLALKTLRGRMGTEDRARFLREGQLAASVSHPHTVYIYGSEEIDGVPVISMELLPGGTLKDRIAAEGPMAPAEAVDVVLQIIGGLDAAQSAGILHRDIKPSNCFTDTDGAVKIGDFGLSISTLARDVRQELTTSGFQGTPQFAAPEQLRGEPLDVRADIYAVGGTLYYLLTGRAPFDARELRDLVERVATEAPASPRRIRREIPPGLAAVVLRCLAKAPADRPASYAALTDLLRPFARRNDAPAHPVVRVFASVCDGLVLAAIGAAFLTVSQLAGVPYSAGSFGAAASFGWEWLQGAVYFLLFEGVSGASPGKRLLRLTVTSARGGRASWAQILLRTLVFFTPAILVSVLVTESRIHLAGTEPGQSGWSLTTDRGGIAILVGWVLFITMRRRNGWAAVHDLVSGTRVVVRAAGVSRPAGVSTVVAATTAASTSSGRRYGPFVAVSELGATGSGRLVAALDPVLRRRVWIHDVLPDTPPVSNARRIVGRAGRLHWLTGKRSPDENWDAFEAPDGEPLLPADEPLTKSTEWARLKHQLLDLSHELVAATRDGTLPSLALDRLWRRTDGRVILLDFTAPGRRVNAGLGNLTPLGLLSSVAAQSFPNGTTRGAPRAMPLSAAALLDRWRDDSMSIEDAHAALAKAAVSADEVSRARRAVPIGMAAIPIVLIIAGGVAAVPAMTRMASPDSMQMFMLLQRVRDTAPTDRFADPTIKEAAERYISYRWAATLASDEFWAPMAAAGPILELRDTANGILTRHPSVSAEEFERARALLGPDLANYESNPAGQPPGFAGDLMLLYFVVFAVAAVVFVSVISSLVIPGGLGTRQLGLAVVTRRGVVIGRVRSLVRVLVAWSPCLLWQCYLVRASNTQPWPPPDSLVGASVALGLVAVGAAWTIARPSRGPHDWLTGTCVVPR